MRAFVAGATGAIGKQLVPLLVEAGHEVHGMTHHESKQTTLAEMGAVPVVADALDPEQVADVVGKAQPEVIVHQLTSLADWGMRAIKRGAAITNRLRIEGTDHLLSAGQAVGWILIGGCVVLLGIPAIGLVLMALVGAPFFGLLLVAFISSDSDSKDG